MKTKCIFSWVLVLIILLCGCSTTNIEKMVETDINFNRDKVFLLTQEYLAEITDDSCIIYKVNIKNGKKEKYDAIDGKYEVADFSENTILLQNKQSLISYNIDSKESFEFYDSIFGTIENTSYIKYQTFFAKGTDYLIVKKIVLDKDKPIIHGDTSVGYQVSEDSGIYIYDISTNQFEFVNKVTVSDLGIKLDGAEEIDISAVDIGDGNISIVVKLYPATIPFFTEYYYKFSVLDLSYIKLGESSITESQDGTMQYSYLNNRLIKASDEFVLCVDFESEKFFKFEHKDLGMIKGVDILDVPDSKYFFINLSTSSEDIVLKYKINEKGLSCEDGNVQMLATVDTIQNGFDRGNKIFFPKDEEARKFGTLFVNGSTYRSYSNEGYLCENDGKTVVIFE